MKHVIFAVTLLVGFVVFAQEAKVSPAIVVPSATDASGDKSVNEADELAKKKAAREKIVMEKVGGYLIKPGSQQGEIVYVNCQTSASDAWIMEHATAFAEATKFKISVKQGAFNFANPTIEGNATLFIIDDASMPAILVAPENRWAFVNVAVIAKNAENAPSPAFFKARFQKELTRGFSFLCGATNSQYQRALTRGIVNHEDLDKNPDFRLPVDVMARFRTYMETLGVTPAIRTTYRQAVHEGWAPEPQNEFQQKIWNQIRSVPEKPIEIK